MPGGNCAREAFRQEFKEQWKTGRPQWRWHGQMRNDTRFPSYKTGWHAIHNRIYI